MARLKKGEEKKEAISIRIKPNTLSRLRKIDKFHSKIDNYINLGIDFENILKLSRDDMFSNIERLQEKLMSFPMIGYGEISPAEARFYFDKTDEYFKEMFDKYDDDIVSLLRIFYLIAFTDESMFNALPRIQKK